MADVKTSIVAIDSAMDCFEKITSAASENQGVVKDELSELGASLDNKIRILTQRINYLYRLLARANAEDDDCSGLLAEIEELQTKLEALKRLKNRQSRLDSQYKSESSNLLSAINSMVSTGLKAMYVYMREINKIEGVNSEATANITNIFTGESNYRVVVIDSSKYPETADHISDAMKAGHPAMLTLNRHNADNNRRLSLEEVPRIPNLDRDEYPPAAFAEGGGGAHVWHINPSDNQGSGATFRWQLNRVEDGTRVRFRVI
ncbi:MAG: hypothetical protein H0S79_20835 [Anaerolineaceae bacterium]|nr:hypothetical protein [Anaerolineaceae bacterium]